MPAFTLAAGADDTPGSDQGLLTSRPPEAFVLVRQWVLDTPQELSAFRASLQHEIAGATTKVAPALHQIARDLVLVASELTTNALRHGIPPTVVRLSRDLRTFLLDVADHDVSTVPYLAGERAPGEGGFGLQIARRIALDVGWYALETTKHVWARFPVAPPEAAPAT